MAELRQLTKLVHPFPSRLVHENPTGYGSYVAHPIVEQRLINVLGAPPITSVVEILRGEAAGKGKGSDPLPNVIVGVVMRMDVTIDGIACSVEEVGDCELPSNWPHDGARLKDAMSDAYKRCAMRLGVGLHLWAQEDFYLSKKLLKQDGAEPEQENS